MLRAITAYIIAFGAVAAWAPYLAVYYNKELGISLPAVGLLMAMTSSVSLVCAPVWGSLHDHHPESRLLLPLAAGVASIGAFGLWSAGPSPLLAGSAALFAIGVSGLMPMMDVRVLEMVSADRTRYAQVRVWGSISFIVLAPLVGLLTVAHGLHALFWVMIPGLFLGGLAATMLPGRSTTIKAPSLRHAPGAVLRHRPIGLFLIGAFVGWTAVASQNTFFTIYLVQLGAPTDLAGSAWSIAALLEVPTMFFFPVLARRFGVERLIILGALILVVRQAANVIFTDPNVLIAASLLQGAGYGLMLIGAITFVSHQAPKGTAATAQGIFNAVAGSLASIVGSGVGGQLAGLLTIRGLYAISACLGLLAVVLIAAAVLPVARAASEAPAPEPLPAPEHPPAPESAPRPPPAFGRPPSAG